MSYKTFKSLSEMYTQPGPLPSKYGYGGGSASKPKSKIFQGLPAVYNDFVESGDYCAACCECGEQHVCTRPEDHNGDHEAHHSTGNACCFVWSTEPEMDEDEDS